MGDTAFPPNQPLVTVALSVLNGGPLLALSVQSVLNQSWGNWELLIFDDGSTDGAIERLKCLSDFRIRVVRDGRRRGLAARLNQAIAMAKGKYFCRMDHDDVCHPERFAKQIAFLERQTEVDLLATQCVTMNESEQLNGSLPSETVHADICRRPWRGFYMAHPTWMGRTEWFRSNLYKEPAPYCCEDQELLLRAHQSSRYHVLPERLLAYRVRSHTPWLKQFRTHMALGRVQFRYLRARGLWAQALLSRAVALGRIVRDSLGEVCHCLSLPIGKYRGAMPSVAECREWNALINGLNAAIKVQDGDMTDHG